MTIPRSEKAIVGTITNGSTTQVDNVLTLFFDDVVRETERAQYFTAEIARKITIHDNHQAAEKIAVTTGVLKRIEKKRF